MPHASHLYGLLQSRRMLREAYAGLVRLPREFGLQTRLFSPARVSLPLWRRVQAKGNDCRSYRTVVSKSVYASLYRGDTRTRATKLGLRRAQWPRWISSFYLIVANDCNRYRDYQQVVKFSNVDKIMPTYPNTCFFCHSALQVFLGRE